jgi:signal transduction histidine kinase
VAANSPTLQEVLLGIIEVQPVEHLLRRLAEVALELTGADYAALGAYGDGRSLNHFESFGLSRSERAAIPHPPLGKGLLGEFALRRDPINVAEASEHPASSGYPAGHPPMGPFLGVPLRYGGRSIGAFYVSRRPGAPRFSTDDQAQLEALAPYAAIAIANAIRLEGEQRQRMVAETLAEVARGLQDATGRQQAARALRRGIAALIPSAQEVVVVCSDPDEAGGMIATSSLPDPGLAPVILDLVSHDLDAGRHEHVDLVAGSIVTTYAAHLADGGELIFALQTPRPLDLEAQVALGAAMELGVMGCAALLRRQAQVALEEYQVRDAIARDLHDDIIQAIYAVGLGLHSARSRDDVSKDEALTKAAADLNVVIGELRAYITHLIGEAPMSGGLLEARLRSIFQGRTRATWDVEIDLPDGALDSALERQVYLLTRELISNVERHSQASHATLRVQILGDDVQVEVTDDGVGFDLGAVPDGKVGVRSVQQRVADLDGSLIFETAPGRGTIVRVQVPLSDRSLA